MSGSARLEVDGAVATLVFDHPERRNALSRAMWEAIPPLVAQAEGDSAVRVLVLRGAGDVAFVAGADISEFEQNRVGPGAAEYDRTTDAAFRSIADCGKPVVAMIHGFCIGGGCGIALQADLRYAADDASFAIPPARLGLGYSPANVEALEQVVGQAAAREILFTARRYGARHAERIGLVHEVFAKDALEDEVGRLVAKIARNAPLTIRAAKLSLGELRRAPGERDSAAMAESAAACFESEDYREGVRAFLEKRAPRFRGD